jgi:thiamine-phosphate pyrophosphorylase
MMKNRMNHSNCISHTGCIASSLRGLYAITDAKQSNPAQLINDVEQALLGGARIIQYRDKTKQHTQRRNTAQQLRELTRQHRALLIINDDVQLAKHSHADGVHLGRDDANIAAARQLLDTSAIIGVSCYNDFALATQAVDRGADYIAFGRFFPSRTKPNAALADIELLQRAKLELDIPVVAIGGITANNADMLLKAGAHMLAVVDDLFGQHDIKAAAQQYQPFFPT